MKLCFYLGFCQKGPFFSSQFLWNFWQFAFFSKNDGQTVSEKLTKIKEFQWNCPNFETGQLGLPMLFLKKKQKNPSESAWNFPAFGIEKNGPTYADFEACPKFVFSSFKTQKLLAFLKNWQTFLCHFFFSDTTDFFPSKI